MLNQWWEIGDFGRELGKALRTQAAAPAGIACVTAARRAHVTTMARIAWADRM
jgi:hypothetical protein